MFKIVTVISGLGFFFWLTSRRFRDFKKKEKSSEFKYRSYFVWLVQWIKSRIRSFKLKRTWEILRNILNLRYPPRIRWIFISLGSSFLFLAASGFLFALFISQRMYGLVLLFHVSIGGIFAICLSLIVFLRAQKYRVDALSTNTKNVLSEKNGEAVAVTHIQIILFWFFVASGSFLILTALIMMLPFFSLHAQNYIYGLHKYSALAALISGLAFVDFALFYKSE